MISKEKVIVLIFDKIFSCVSSNRNNYIPREHRTIGGMWTADTWKFNGVTCRLEDEGYSRTILTDDEIFYAHQFSDKDVRIDKGNIEDLLRIYKKISS